MPKPEIIFECEKCGAQYPKWTGRCAQCGAWSLIRESFVARPTSQIPNSTPPATSISFSSVAANGTDRIPTGIAEVDRVLGGGLIRGAVLLLTGEPGNGKSTLAGQLANTIRTSPQPSPYKGEGGVGSAPLVPSPYQGEGRERSLYISGEESAEQVRLRLDRLGVNLERINFLGQTDARVIAATIAAERPVLCIIDSIQTMRAEGAGEAGSLGQIKASAAVITEAAKTNRVPTLIIGQVTKDGGAAGPKSLEHLVDVVLSLEGDRESAYRVLRAEKNRFGATDEIGVFTMHERGLREVANPSELFVRERSPLAGSCMTCVLEGSRAMLVEVQALAHPSAYGTPIRRASGIDLNRLQMICAVLSARARVPLGKADVHVNVVGGIKLREPAADLAIALAIHSTIKNRPLGADVCAFGELGLGGELRSVRGSDRRITEALRFGLKKIISPPDLKTITDALN